MGIILSLLLVVLGIIGAETLVSAKVPSCKKYVDKISQYRAGLGFAGLTIAIAYFIQWLALVHFVGLSSFRIVLAMIAALLTLILGFIFGLSFIRENLKNPNASFLIKADGWRAKLLPYQQQLGLAGIVVGILSLLLML